MVLLNAIEVICSLLTISLRCDDASMMSICYIEFKVSSSSLKIFGQIDDGHKGGRYRVNNFAKYPPCQHQTNIYSKKKKGIEMTKKAIAFVLILTISMVLLIKVGPVSAAEKTTFPSYSVLEQYLDLGTWSYPDGNIHIRGMVQLFRNTGPDPRVTGYNTVTVNANWQSDYTGPMSGTFHFETGEGGLWEGTWAGQMTEAGPVYTGAADGYGIYDGMKMWVDMNYGVCTITILEH